MLTPGVDCDLRKTFLFGLVGGPVARRFEAFDCLAGQLEPSSSQHTTQPIKLRDQRYPITDQWHFDSGRNKNHHHIAVSGLYRYLLARRIRHHTDDMLCDVLGIRDLDDSFKRDQVACSIAPGGGNNPVTFHYVCDRCDVRTDLYP